MSAPLFRPVAMLLLLGSAHLHQPLGQVPVRPDVSLSSSQVGQEVVIITSTTLAVTVTSQ